MDACVPGPNTLDCVERQKQCNVYGVDFTLGLQFSAVGRRGNHIRLNLILLDREGILVGPV